MPNLHTQIKCHQQWQLALVCPSPLTRKERDGSGRLRELVSPDSPLGHGEIGAHLCHRQWGSSLCVTLLSVSTGQGEELHPQGITALAKIGRKE